VRVRCTKVVNPLRALVIPIVGDEYVVLELACVAESAPMLRIVMADQSSLWTSDMFEATDGSIPRQWRAQIDGDGSVFLGPSEWQSRSFWDDFYDGKAYARALYAAGLKATLDES
jgi:hypothetical protein